MRLGEIAYLGDTFILSIEWDKPGMPRCVGPFADRSEAREWGELNIPNGSWEIVPLRWPYAPPRGELMPASSGAGQEEHQ